ncbi:MAG: type II and III secretion system protein [Fibrobacter sp.]|nr:type II and III secretion system protein [Fibrobacter sp.]
MVLAQSMDFVDTPLQEVIRAVSLAFDTPILVDGNVERKVTFHLDGLGFLEGVTALCEANGLELVQDGNVYRVRNRTWRGEHEFRWIAPPEGTADSLVDVSVREKDVREFVREYALNSGLNILMSPEVQGQISGELHRMQPRKAFVSLMQSCGFRIREMNGYLYVQMPKAKNSNDGSGEDKVRIERNDSLYSASIKDAPLMDVLVELSEVAALNLAMYGDVRETVRLKFEDVSLQVLIEALFKGRGLSYALDGGTLYVSEGGSRNALMSTRLYPLKHVHSEKALNYLGKFSSGSNYVATEIKEQNALLLGGSAAEIQMAEAILSQIDVPALQVTLSCIIVEFKKGNLFEIGLRGGAARKSAAGDLNLRGYLDFLGKDRSGVGAVGKIGLLPDRFEMELASMEERNEAEILARPKLTTLNGNKAELNVTNTVYYLVSQVSAEGYPITDYRSFNDGISLELTPSVTQEGSITLEVSPEIKTAGRSSGDGPRDISTRNLKTMVRLKDGETLCLGGLIRKNKSEVRSAVPFLGSLPFIGRLFSYTSEEEETNELAIFITPKVESHGAP